MLYCSELCSDQRNGSDPIHLFFSFQHDVSFSVFNSSCFCCYITNTHKLFRYAISTEDNASNKVPENFPCTIGLVSDNDSTIVLNPAYRTDNDEFKYYISWIVAAINLTCTKFSQRKCRDLLSDIHSVTDKAFGLLVIYNEHQVWKDQEEMKRQGNKGKTIKKRKRFCSGNSGNRKE